MKHPLNEEQTKAVAEFETDLLVAAGAGTGKTSVLTGKYLRLLAEKRAGVAEIVAITFTKKAAAEMRDRIQQEIQIQVAEAQTPKAKEFWQNQLLNLEKARIGTFHGFCLGLLREHPLEAGIPPVTGILSEGEETIYLRQACEEVLLDVFQDRQFAKDVLTRMVLESGWESFLKTLAGIYQKIRESGQSFPEIISRSSAFLEEKIAQTLYQPFHLIEAIEDLLNYSGTVQLTERAGEIIQMLRQAWPEQRAVLGGDDPNTIFATMTEIKKGLPKNVPNVIKERVAEIHEIIGSLAGKLIDRESLTRLPVIGEFLTRIDEKYAALKKGLGLLDFSDQLLLTRDLLKNRPEIAARVSREIGYLLVDEFQDTNSLQFEIVDLLVGSDYTGGRLMAVGDIKQSIYRFRGAEADVITGLARRFQKENRGKVVPLTRNYRSNRQLIAFINEISGQLFEGEEFVYDPLVAAKEDGEFPPVEFILTGSQDRQTEASLVARRIQQLVAANTGIGYGDIVILFRAGASIPLYQQALEKMGIPYYMASGGGFYNRPEVVDQLNLLRLVEQRYNGLALLGLLTSPFVGLTAESLLWLGAGKDLVEQFYSREGFPAEIPEVERARLANFRDLLEHLQRNRENLSIPALLRLALEESNYREVLWPLPNACQRLANLDKLLEKADEFTAKGFYDVQQFLEYIEKLEAVEVLEGEAQTQAESGEAVRLMTIHRAKGLEFPVVIIPDLDRQPPPGGQGRLFFHRRAGIGMSVQFGEGERGVSSLGEKIKSLDKREELSELKRVLYVAMTRARRQLILAGSGCNRSKAMDINAANNWMKWFELLLPLEKAGPVLDFHGIPVKITRWIPEHITAAAGSAFLEENESLLAEDDEIENGDTREIAVTAMAEATVNRTFKVSEFLAFKECPRRYFWEYRCGLTGIASAAETEAGFEAGRGSGTVIGSFLHQAFQAPDPDWPERLWQKILPELSGSQTPDLKADLMRMWRNFRRSRFTEEYGTHWDEVPFLVKLDGGFRLEGRFDRLLESKNGELILIDYKTHRLTGEEAAVKAGDYLWQLQLYALAAAVLWGRLPDQAFLYFPYPDASISVPLDKDSLNRTQTEISAIVSFVESHDDLADYPQIEKPFDCRGCRYFSEPYCSRGR